MSKNRKDNQDSSIKLLNSIIDSAFFAIMAFKSIRDEENEIVDFEWIFANKIACKIVDYSLDALIGSKLLELLPGNLEAGLFDKYKKVVEEGEDIHFEQYYNADNIDTWFNISASKMGDGFTVTFQDISKFKKAQAEVETKSNKYQKLFEESIDAIFLLDRRLMFLDVNSSLLQLFGLKMAETIGSPVKQLFYSSNDYNSFKDKLNSNKKIEEWELILLARDKEKKYCLINSVPIYDEEKLEQNYLGVIRDMTKRKQAEKDIFIAEKLSMTGKIARTIAHEIRNPLTNLSLALEQLKEEIPEEVEDAELYLSIIERNSSRIGKLINDLLNSSKPKELKLQNQPVHSIIKQTLTLVEDRLKLQNMKLEEKFEAEDISIPIDADQFRIALLNIFINAIEAMRPNKGVLQVTTEIYKNKFRLRIKDNGKGIPKKDMQQLFEPFFTSKKDGAGLGLTTFQNIIHSHHGSIEVESELGKGTLFIICFPIRNVD